MRRWGVAMAGGMLLCGCTSVTEPDLARLRVGHTTAAEAVAVLGPADRDEVLGDGSRMLTYIGSAARTRPANLVPGLVYFRGGWDVTSEEAGLMFSPDGTLRFYSWSSKDQIPIRAVGDDAAPVPQSDPHDHEGDSPPAASGSR